MTIAIGETMPFMSSRKNGRPITLRNVLWAGDEPAPAYAFHFYSKGRRWRCITPKACSNFFVVDEGPLPPQLQLSLAIARMASICDPIELSLVVGNPGMVLITNAVVSVELPEGLVLPDGTREWRFESGSLNSGEGRRFVHRVNARKDGVFEVQAVAATGGLTAVASAGVTIGRPVIALDCAVPGAAPMGRPVELCLSVRNAGNVPEPMVRVEFPIPDGVQAVPEGDDAVVQGGVISWELPEFVPGRQRNLCVRLLKTQAGSVPLVARAVSICSTTVETHCEARFSGIPAILLEVVDTEDPVEVGGEVTYIIKVTNQGSAPGTNIRVNCVLPPSQSFISGSGSSAVKGDARSVTMDVLPVLGARAVATWTLKIRAVSAGDSRFLTFLSSDQFSEPIREEEPTQQY